MELGERDGFGLYGILDEDAVGLLCHECGERFGHLGLHVWRRHGVRAREYREVHGLLLRRGLVTVGTREKLVANAVVAYPGKRAFQLARDPGAASRAAAASDGMSPAGLTASRTRVGQGRKGRVVECVVVPWVVLPVAGCDAAQALLEAVRGSAHAGGGEESWMRAVKAPAMEARGLAWRLCSGLYALWWFVRWPVALFAVFIAVTMGASPMGIDLGTRVQLVIGGVSVGGLLIYANVDWDRRVVAASRYWDEMPEPAPRSLRDRLLGRGADSASRGDRYGVDFMFVTRRTLRDDPEWTALRTAVLKSTQAARGQFVVLLVLLFLIVSMLSFAGVPDFGKLRAVAMPAIGAIVVIFLLTTGVVLLRDAPTQRAEFREWVDAHPRHRRPPRRTGTPLSPRRDWRIR